jgi:phage-related minor tail protein
MTLATLITALHFRPLQKLPMVFAPLLLFSSYLNVAGFKIDSAGMTAAWSGLYVLLAARRRPVAGLRGKISARGVVRGAAMGLGVANMAGGGLAYALGNRAAEEEERRERNRWGIYKE